MGNYHFLAALFVFALATLSAGQVGERQAFSADGLRQAARTKGTIQLPEGVIDLGDLPLNVSDGVTIVGAGLGKTVLLVRSTSTVALFGNDIRLADLTIRQSGNTPGVNPILRGHWGPRNDRVTLERVAVEINTGVAPTLKPGDDQTIKDCRFVSTSMTDSALNVNGGVRLSFTGNFVRYRTGRAKLAFTTDSTIADNAFEIDGNYRGSGRPETGGVELSYAANLDFKRNRIEQTGNRDATGDNDGEMLGTQNSNIPEYVATGTVTSIGSSVGVSFGWGASPWNSLAYPLTKRKALYVLTGPAAGSRRWATQGPTDGSITLDASIPGLGIGDVVSLSSVPAYNVRITDNAILGGRNGISIYNGAEGVQISGNAIDVTGAAIHVRSDSRTSVRVPGFAATTHHWPVWDFVATGNAIAGGYVLIQDRDVSGTGLALAMRHVHYGGNAIVDPRGVVVESINETTGLPASAGRLFDVGP